MSKAAFIFTGIIIAVLLVAVEKGHCLHMASFNLQVFGVNKAKNKMAMRNIVKILQRYDLVVLQEIRDKTGRAIKRLMLELNKASQRGYSLVLSQRDGRTKSKEQYAAIYDPKLLKIKKAWLYEDELNHFERSPFFLQVSSVNSKFPEFLIVVNHLDPDDVAQEMEALYGIINSQKSLEYENLLIAGDLNADCGYLPKRKRKTLSFSRDKRYKFLISDDMDTTTTGKTDCAYDRFIARGDELMKYIVQLSSKPFDYAKILKLSDKQSAEISDHKPIELKLRSPR